MKIKFQIKKKIIIAIFAFFGQIGVNAETIEIEPLFEYPMAPEELPTLTEKSNYLVDHFWDQFDFKNKTAVDQNALNDAFRVYSTPLLWANMDKSMASLDKLISNISKNPTILLQFTKAAEENLYGPRAEVWSDELYMKFLNAIIKNKKIKPERKAKYEKQAAILSNSMLNGPAPKFDFTDRDGNKRNYFPMSTPTMIIFGDPDDPDWRIARLKMETNNSLSQALEKGKLNILFIIPGELQNWKDLTSTYPSSWIIGEAPKVSETVDMRAIPSIYLISSEGKTILKNQPLAAAINTALSLIE